MHDLIIVKDNELIENFIFNTTELELQILNYAVAITNPYWDNKDYVYKISIPELVATYKTKSKNAYKVYREALERLQVRTYKYHDGVKEVRENVLRKIMRDTTDNSYLELCFNDYIANRLQNLKGLFTQYDIKNIANFKSRYAYMLYEFFKMKLNQVDSFELKYNEPVTLFRKRLDISSKYIRFNQLKEFVLDKAKTNINKHSDIQLDYEVIKTGRTPTHIKFKAKYKKGKQPLIDTQKATTAPDKKTTKALKQDKTIDYVKAQPIPDKTQEQINKDRERVNSLKDTVRKAGVKM